MIERFHRTMSDGWAYARRSTTESARTAIGKVPPITRLSNNLPGHYSYASNSE